MIFLIGLLTNLPPGDFTIEGQNSIPPEQAEISGGNFNQLLH
jgi:hypothetical protein